MEISAFPDDVEQLKQLLGSALDALKSKSLEVELLKVQLMRLRRMQFGQSSEKLAREIAQLELTLEDLEAESGDLPVAEAGCELVELAAGKTKPARRALPDHLPRETVRHEIGPVCPDCGGPVRPAGEDCTQVLDYVPGHFKVIEHIRPKLSCRACDTLHQAPAPLLPIERGRPGPGLLAHVLVSKYADHLPLYRQAEMFARDGVELSRSTLAGWVGRVAWELRPLIDAVAAHVLAAPKVHGDDTPVPVLAPGAGKTRTGRLWAYVRDDRPYGGADPPAVFYRYSADRRGEHPRSHLADYRGALQADGYAGFDGLYEAGAVTEVACWAHVRRKIHDVHVVQNTATTTEALERIGRLYQIEAEMRGRPATERQARRQAAARPQLNDLKHWLETTLRRISGKSELAKAIRYALNRWDALVRYCEDGRLEIDNNTAERAIRAIALGRKNWLFAGSDDGGNRAAAVYTLIETAKLNGVDPRAYLTDVLARIASHPAKQIADLLPWTWLASHPDCTRQAA